MRILDNMYGGHCCQSAFCKCCFRFLGAVWIVVRNNFTSRLKFSSCILWHLQGNESHPGRRAGSTVFPVQGRYTATVYTRLQLKCDGTRWRTGLKWGGNWRMEWVASTLHTISERGLSGITAADAHTSTVSSQLNWRPRRFKWTRPFRRKTKSGFCVCAITFQLASTMYTNLGTVLEWMENRNFWEELRTFLLLSLEYFFLNWEALKNAFFSKRFSPYMWRLTTKPLRLSSGSSS